MLHELSRADQIIQYFKQLGCEYHELLWFPNILYLIESNEGNLGEMVLELNS